MTDLPGGPVDRIRLTGPRAADWSCDVLTKSGQLKGPLRSFKGGTLEQNNDRAVRGGGSVDMTWEQDDEPDINWGSDRFAIKYTVNGVTWPMGVFLISTPAHDYNDDDNTVTTTVTIMDKLSVLVQDVIDGSYSVAADELVTDVIKTIILGTGETAIAVTDSAKTVRSPGLAWEAGTSKLNIVNDLLSHIGYEDLWCDGSGYYRAGPYIDPAERPVVYNFAHGAESLHVAQWNRENDWFEIPNKIVLVSQADEETPALISILTNTNPDSPYSYPSRGRWIVHTETDVSVSDQASLNQLAKMRMGQLSSKVSNLTVQHAMLNLNLNDRIKFTARNHTADAWIRAWSVSMTPDGLVTGQWREVAFT